MLVETVNFPLYFKDDVRSNDNFDIKSKIYGFTPRLGIRFLPSVYKYVLFN